jgi:hypothetical protein
MSELKDCLVCELPLTAREIHFHFVMHKSCWEQADTNREIHKQIEWDKLGTGCDHCNADICRSTFKHDIHNEIHKAVCLRVNGPTRPGKDLCRFCR